MIQLPQGKPRRQLLQQPPLEPRQQHQWAPTSTQAPTSLCSVRAWRVPYRRLLTPLRSTCHLGPICHPLRHSALRRRTGPHQHGHLREHLYQQLYHKLRTRVSCHCSPTTVQWTQLDLQADLPCGSTSGRGGRPRALSRALQMSVPWRQLQDSTTPSSET